MAQQRTAADAQLARELLYRRGLATGQQIDQRRQTFRARHLVTVSGTDRGKITAQSQARRPADSRGHMKPSNAIELAAALSVCACAAHQTTTRSTGMPEHVVTVPDPATFTRAPLRNRIRVELNAAAEEVWQLVGNLERYPEYTAGIERVSVTTDGAGRCTEYVCHFRPQGPGQPSVSHREVMRWFEAGHGYASLAAEPNDLGLSNCLTMVTLERAGDHTVLTWTEHFDSVDVAMHKAVFDEALADIGGRLAARFGGTITERFVEPSR